MSTYSRYRQVDYSGLLGGFIASSILHCVMYAIASTTTIFYPPAADRELISIDLFFASKGSQSTDSPVQPLSQIRSIEPVEQERFDDNETEAPYNSKDLELISVRAPKPGTKNVQLARTKPEHRPAIEEMKQISKPPPAQIVIPPAEKAQEPEIKNELTENRKVSDTAPPAGLDFQTKTIAQSEQDKQAIEDDKIRRLHEEEQLAAIERAEKSIRAAEAARAAELEREEVERAAKAKLAAEKIQREREAAEKAEKARIAAERAQREREAADKARSDRIAKLKQDEERVSKEKMARERAAEENAAKAKMAQVQTLRKTEQKDIPINGKTDRGKDTPNSLRKDGATLPTVAATPQKIVKTDFTNTENELIKKQPEQKGLAIPPVNGEIKLTVTSTEEIGITVQFVSFPKSKHHKAITRNEAKEEQKIKPVIVRTAKSTLEVVIERAKEGIYIFHAEQKGNRPAKGRFSLNIFESKDRLLSFSEISAQTEIARLLMPEGILWEDDKAFSGNIEDSESVTKFNSETGLVWKEYRK